jgi:hypothetical protein
MVSLGREAVPVASSLLTNVEPKELRGRLDGTVQSQPDAREASWQAPHEVGTLRAEKWLSEIGSFPSASVFYPSPSGKVGVGDWHVSKTKN